MAAPHPALQSRPGRNGQPSSGAPALSRPRPSHPRGQSASWVSGEPASDVPLPSSTRTAAVPWGTGPVPAPSTRGRAPSVRPAVLSSSAVVPPRGPLITSQPGGASPRGTGSRETAQPAGTASTRPVTAAPVGAGTADAIRTSTSAVPAPVPATPSQATVAPVGSVAPTRTAWSASP